MRRARLTLTVWTEGSWDEAGRAQQVITNCLTAAKEDGELFDFTVVQRGEMELTESQENAIRTAVKYQ